MSDRILELLDPKVADALVNQLAHELKNYNLYKTFANYFAVKGLDDLSIYFNMRAKEEKEHSEWIHDYLTNADHLFNYPEIEINSESIESLIDPFILTVKREIETTQLLYGIDNLCEENDDLMTCTWLRNGLINEQTEEENVSRMAQTIMELDGDIFQKSKKVLELLDARTCS